jgi:hypothetical protein
MNTGTLRMLVHDKLDEISVGLGFNDYPHKFVTRPAQMTGVSSFKFIVHLKKDFSK